MHKFTTGSWRAYGLPVAQRHYHDIFGSDAPAPNTAGLEQVSRESAEIAERLGNRQMDEAARQYGTNLNVIAPLVDQQIQAGRLSMRNAIDDRNFYESNARVIDRGLYAEMLGDESPIQYYGYQPMQPGRYDPNEIGPAQRAAASYNATRPAATATTTTSPEAQGLIKGADGRYYRQTINPSEQDGSMFNPALGRGTASYEVVPDAEVRSMQSQQGLTTGGAAAVNAAGPGNSIIGDTFYRTAPDGSQRGFHVVREGNGAFSLHDRNGQSFAQYTPEQGFFGIRPGTEAIVNDYMRTQQAGGNAATKATGQFSQGNDVYFAGGKTPLHVTRGQDGTITLSNAQGQIVAGTKMLNGAPTVFGNAGVLRQFMSDEQVQRQEGLKRANEPKVSGDTVTANGKTYTIQRGPDGWVAKDADGKAVASWSATGGATGDTSITNAVNGAQFGGDARTGSGEGGDSSVYTPQTKTYDWKAQTAKGQDEAAGRGVADYEQGLAQSRGAMARQLRGMGMNMNSPAALAAMAAFERSSAAGRANAANLGRRTAKNEDFAKRMTLAGRGDALPGYANAAFGTANQSASAATGNQLAPGNAYMTGLSQGVNTTIAGRGLLQSGLQGAAGLQTQWAGQQDSGLGGVLGFGASMLTAPSTSIIGKLIG